MVMDGYHSQDRLSKLREKISKQHLNLILEEVPSKHEIRLKLLDAIRDYLLIAPPTHKYLLPETATTLHQSAQLPNFTAYKASQGWDAIAKYAENLISQPWRKEYKQINTYSGYYKHEVEANLDTVANQMFQVMGYRMEDGGVLVLDGPVCPDRVTCVSLDAIFAYVECQILNEIYEEIYQSTSIEPAWSEIVDFRDTHDCSPKETARSLIDLSGANQQQQLASYGNTTVHGLQQLIDTDSSTTGGVYYNKGPMLPYGGGSGVCSKKLLNGANHNGAVVGDPQEQQLLAYEPMEYGNILAQSGHAIAAAYSFPPLRHHTQQPSQYYLPYDMDCYNRYSQCGANGMIMPMQQYYTDPQHHHHGTPMMYPLMKQPPPCCGGGNGYIVPDMSVPSTAAITPAQQPTSCLCNHLPPSRATLSSSMVPTAQLIDFDNTNQYHPQQQLQHQQISHDVPDGLATMPRMRNNQQQATYYQQPQYHRATTHTAYVNGNHHNTSRRERGNDYTAAHASQHEDVSGSCVEHRRGVSGDKAAGLKGERELRVEEGSGTYEGWDYVYKNLESQGYSKDLGERGDILDRSSKRRTTINKSAELPEKLNGLTITAKYHKPNNQTPYERRNSDETQSSYYDNVPTSKTVTTMRTVTTKTPMPGHATSILMQQKMKSNRLSEIKAKVDSRRTNSKMIEIAMNENGDRATMMENTNYDSKDIVKYSTSMSNGVGKRQITKQPSQHGCLPNMTEDTIITASLQRPLSTHNNPHPTTTTKSPPKTSVISPPLSATVSSMTWECTSCTYLNTKDNSNICEMCAKTRDVASLDTSMEIGGPECLNCTLVNPKGAEVCQACEDTLNNSPTYI